MSAIRYYTDSFDKDMLDFIKHELQMEADNEDEWDVTDAHLVYSSNLGWYWTCELTNPENYEYLTKQQFKEKIGMTTKQFSKKDLKTGMILVFNNGEYATVLLGTANGDIVTGDSWFPLKDYEDGQLFNAKGVRKVLQPKSNRYFNLVLAKEGPHWTEYEVVWEYKEKSASQIELEKLQQQIAELQDQANKLKSML